jgi:outer membrane protein TolC
MALASRSAQRGSLLQVLIGAVTLLAGGLAAAQTNSTPLTLDDCIRLALAAPSTLTAAQQELDIAQYGLRQARAGFLPQSQLGNGFTYNSPLAGSPDQFSFVALNGIREYASQFTVLQEFDTSGRLRAALARARADRSAAVASAGMARRDLRRAVTAAYYQLLVARRMAVVSREALEEARSFERGARLLAANGEAAQADVVKAAAQAAFLEQSQRAAELEAEIANHELASFWTQDAREPLAVEDVLDRAVPPPETPAPAAGRLFLRRPEFDFSEARRQGFLADARQARAQLLPQMNLVFQYGIDSLHVRIRDRGYAAFINLNIPVFDWFRARSQARQSELRASQVELIRSAAARGFSKDYENALARVRLIYDQLAATLAQVQLSEESLRLSRLRYDEGEGSALDVVAAEAQVVQARSNRYASIAAYLNARADLEVASGR